VLLNHFLIRIMVSVYQCSDSVLPEYGPVWTASGMGYWKEMIRITGDTNCYYYTIKLSYPTPIYDLCDTVIALDMLILLHWGNSNVWARLWWHELYVKYIRVFLFGLSSQRINLMNLKSKPIQLVLSTLVFNILLDVFESTPRGGVNRWKC